MVGRGFGWVAAVLLAFVGTLALCVPAQTASRAGLEPACWASGPLAEDPASLWQADGRWNCNDRPGTIADERYYFRFDMEPGDPLPELFTSRRAAFEELRVLWRDADGVHQRRFGTDRLENSQIGGYFKLQLPRLAPSSRQVIVAIDLPSHRMTLEHMQLAPQEGESSQAMFKLNLLLAALCGMLVMPLVFNLAFYRVLREPFVLWHSALTITLLLTIAVSSVLAGELFALPVMTLSWMATIVFGLSVAAGAMFAWSFIEPGMLSPRLRRLLPWCAVAAICLSGFHAAFPFVARPVQSSIYTVAFAPILVVFLVALWDAVRRGSRAAKFQIVGWMPMVGVALTRLVTMLVPGFQTNDAMLLFYVGCVFEVLSTTMGVADRFMSLKHERDRAVTEAEVLERLSERDPLTGLFNRRALEEGFDLLRARGFNALAVLDLDRFKAINDGFGHAIGDDVLRAASAALAPDAQTHAYRLGGEEFVLLLKGPGAVEQAERRRLAIPTIVAQRVPGLANPVTASMGLIELPPDAASKASFADFYERADKLLYEAKQAGRNRAMIERLQLFRPSRPANRRKVA